MPENVASQIARMSECAITEVVGMPRRVSWRDAPQPERLVQLVADECRKIDGSDAR